MTLTAAHEFQVDSWSREKTGRSHSHKRYTTCDAAAGGVAWEWLSAQTGRWRPTSGLLHVHVRLSTLDPTSKNARAPPKATLPMVPMLLRRSLWTRMASSTARLRKGLGGSRCSAACRNARASICAGWAPVNFDRMASRSLTRAQYSDPGEIWSASCPCWCNHSCTAKKVSTACSSDSAQTVSCAEASWSAPRSAIPLK